MKVQINCLIYLKIEEKNERINGLLNKFKEWKKIKV